MIDLLERISQDVPLIRTGNTQGGEYSGPCPWCGGRDRFKVWPEHPNGRGRFWCRQCEAGGDAIDYLRRRENLGYQEACHRLEIDAPGPSNSHPQPIREPVHVETLSPPSTAWQEQGRRFVEQARECLWSETGIRALAWLRDRGLEDATLQAAGLGYNPKDRREQPAAWGLAADHKDIWLPRGIVLPWEIGGELWRVNIRRPQGKPKYIGPAGYTGGLYGADALNEHPTRPVVLVEGEFDALTVRQVAGDQVIAVATGSTAGARQPRWLARLAQFSLVLVAFDADDAGDEAADWWLHRLPKGRRWRPFFEDVNEMYQQGFSVRDWIESGLHIDQFVDRGAGMLTNWSKIADEPPVSNTGKATLYGTLEQAIRQARDWRDLETALERAQAAYLPGRQAIYQLGELSASAVESLATQAAAAAQILPEQAVDERPIDNQGPDTCFACGHTARWTDRYGNQKCSTCHPQPKKNSSTTLTRP